ncbi:MAG: OmpA family protein [Prevotella sp.]|nr:OmpA family protein [Prevotella sp.]
MIRTILLSCLLASISLSSFAQSKKASGKSRSASNRNTTTEIVRNDPIYYGEIGDYLPCVVKFQAGQTTVPASSMGSLEDVAKFMRSHPNVKIVIEGSASGNTNFQQLAIARAEAVKKVLVNRFKIAASRMIANPTRPNADNCEFGFINFFVGTSDAVVFYEQGFTTLDECMQIHQEKVDKILTPIAGMMAGVMLGHECTLCLGSGRYNGAQCYKCKGTGYDGGRMLSDGMSIAQGLAAKGKSQSNTYQKTTGSNGWQIKHYGNGIYEGHLTNGKRNGWGRFIWNNGECYTGLWKDDKAVIRGMLRGLPIKQGDRGMLCDRNAGTIGSDGKFSEARALWNYDGTQYIGVIRNGKYSGYGKLLGTNGGVFKGNFTDGKPGKGSRNIGIGTAYGDFSSSAVDFEGLYSLNGKGEYRYDNGDVFRGNIVINFPDGAGELTLKDGTMMYWEFKGMGQMDFSKQGVVKYKNGDIYVGYGGARPEGSGTWYYASTHNYVKGTWKNGEIVETKESGSFTDEDLKEKNGKIKYDNGDTYDGKMIFGLPNGRGTYMFANGDKLFSKFKYGQPGDFGEFTYANGDKYLGDMKDGKMHGNGIYTWTNGDSYIGEFSRGKRLGKGTMRYSNKKYEYGMWSDNKLTVKYDEGKWKKKNDEYEYKSKSNKSPSFLDKLSKFLSK